MGLVAFLPAQVRACAIGTGDCGSSAGDAFAASPGNRQPADVSVSVWGLLNPWADPCTGADLLTLEGPFTADVCSGASRSTPSAAESPDRPPAEPQVSPLAALPDA